jgi:hypothetical protein
MTSHHRSATSQAGSATHLILRSNRQGVLHTCHYCIRIIQSPWQGWPHTSTLPHVMQAGRAAHQHSTTCHAGRESRIPALYHMSCRQGEPHISTLPHVMQAGRAAYQHSTTGHAGRESRTPALYHMSCRQGWPHTSTLPHVMQAGRAAHQHSTTCHAGRESRTIDLAQQQVGSAAHLMM